MYRINSQTPIAAGIALAVSAALAIASGAAHAQAARAQKSIDASDLDEVVVTATKVGSQTVMETPLAIQAFTGETLQTRGIHEAEDLVSLIPGASSFGEISAGYKVYAIRGSGAGGPIGDGMVGYYLDDTPFGVPNFQAAPPVKYFDLDHVEVLRGPQGTLYGSGSMGGVIIYRTKNPDLKDFKLDAEVGTSTTNDAGDLNYRVGTAVSMPLVQDKLALRLSGGYDYQAGYEDVYSGATATGAPYKKDANNIRSSDVQAVLLWKPTDRLTLRMRAWAFRNNQDYLQVMSSLEPPYILNQGTNHSYDNRGTNFFSNTLTYEGDGYTITNATSYQETLPGGFGTIIPVNGALLVNGGAAHGLVDEFRVASSGKGPLHWVGGAYYQDAIGFYNFLVTIPGIFAVQGGTATKTTNESIFAEVSYDLMGGKLVPLFGLRYFQDTRSADTYSGALSNRTFVEGKPDALTWHANLSYHIDSDWMLFLNAGTGFRSGILQSQAQADAVTADGVPSSISLTPDKLRNLEVGVKGTLADGRVQMAVSAYDIKYTNLQSAFNTSSGLAAFANLGDAKTQGVDIDLSWRTPLPGLTASLIGNVNTSEFSNVNGSFASANPGSGNGQRLYNTPPHNWRLDLNYETGVGGAGWKLYTNASATRNGPSRNASPGINYIVSYSMYRASLGLRRGRYDWQLYGDNLGDFRGPTQANATFFLAGPLPRTIGVQLRYKTY
jgi:outer membrane receptor protein involved in Fe transport